MSPINSIPPIRTRTFLKKAAIKAEEAAEKYWHHALMKGASMTVLEKVNTSHDWKSFALNLFLADCIEVTEHLSSKFLGVTEGLMKDSRLTGKQQPTNMLSWVWDGVKAIKKNAKKATIKSKINERIKHRNTGLIKNSNPV